MYEEQFRPGIVNGLSGFWLVTNYSCNSRCSWCYAGAMQGRALEMPVSYSRDVVALVAACGVGEGMLIGGEPTIHKDFEGLLGSFARYDVTPTIVSNGRRYASRSFVEKATAITSFKTAISLHASTQDLHDSITGSAGSFAEAVQGIRNCRDLSIPTSVQVTVSRRNVHAIFDLVRLVEALGVRELVVSFGLPQFTLDLGTTVNGGDLVPVLDMPPIIRDVFLRTRDSGVHVIFNQQLPLCMYGDSLPEMLDACAIRTGCHLSAGNMIVWEPTGAISPCTHFSGQHIVEGLMDEDLRLRITSVDEFLELWNQRHLIDFRRDRYAYVSPNCVDCQYWGLCTGGCPILWFQSDPAQVLPSARARG